MSVKQLFNLIGCLVWKPEHFDFGVVTVHDTKRRSPLSKNIHLSRDF